ncbi:HGGxSTG domain-containing protein [Acidithiobacillus caldus]|jgi:hypothetical protein
MPTAPTADFKPWYDGERDKIICGARTRKGTPCRAQGLGGGNRCKNHGGMSTGPRTEEGRQRALEALARGRETRRSSRL